MLSSEDRERVHAYRLLIADVYELAALSRRQSVGTAEAHGVTPTQWHIMNAVSEEDATVAWLARRLGLTRQAVQRTADQLLGSGHLVSRRNPAHKASPLMHLTDGGREALAGLMATSEGPRAQELQGIPVEDLQQARETLRRVIASI